MLPIPGPDPGEQNYCYLMRIRIQDSDFDEGSFLYGAGAGLVAGHRGHVPATASAPSHWLQAASALPTEEQPASQVYELLKSLSRPPRYMHSFRV